MRSDVFFPTIDDGSNDGSGEVRLVSARRELAESRDVSVVGTPRFIEEINQVRRACGSLDASRPLPGGNLIVNLWSQRASKDTSLHLAVAAAAWAACCGARPRGLLVATGALPDAATVKAQGRLAVLGVGGIGRKARVVAAQLKQGGTLWAHVEPNSQSGYANRPVMFVYPKAATLDADDEAALAELAKLGVQVRAIASFEGLLAFWLPDGTADTDTRWPAIVAAAAIAATVAGAAIWRATPDWLDRTIALAVVPPPLRTLSTAAAADPDAPEHGCAALIDAAAATERAGWGWRAINRRIDACYAVRDCDRLAASPMERADGRLLSQVAANRDELLRARATCALAGQAYPAVARFAYQQWRALSTDGDPTTTAAATAALTRAADLQYAPALAEQTRALAATDPALARARLEQWTSHADADPNQLRVFAELLANKALGPARPDDRALAACLFDRAAKAPPEAGMSADQRARLLSTAETLRDPSYGPSPASCEGVTFARTP